MSDTLPTHLEAYLKAELAVGTERFVLEAALDDSGQVAFQIKPLSPAGFTLDFRVRANQLTTVFFRRSRKLGAGTDSL